MREPEGIERPLPGKSSERTSSIVENQDIRNVELNVELDGTDKDAPPHSVRPASPVLLQGITGPEGR